MSEDKVFSEQEVALILQRAAERQRAQGQGGLTLPELERIAEEAGLNPALVRQVAAELEDQPHPVADGLIPALRVCFEKTLPTALKETDLTSLRELIQAEMNEPGRFERQGQTLTWQTIARVPTFPQNGTYAQNPYNQRDIRITVYPRGTTTTIRVEEKLTNLAGAMFGGWLGGLGGGLLGVSLALGFGVFRSPLVTLILISAALWLGYAVARQSFDAVTRERTVQLQRLFSRLVALT